MNKLGRLIVREDGILGLFIPYKQPEGQQLNQGIWEIVDVLGELQLEYVGKAAMPDETFNGTNVAYLTHNPESVATKEELNYLDNLPDSSRD